MVHPRIKQICQKNYTNPYCMSEGNRIIKKPSKMSNQTRTSTILGVRTNYFHHHSTNGDIRVPKVLNVSSKLKIILSGGLSCMNGHLLCGEQSKHNFLELFKVIKTHYTKCLLCKEKNLKLTTNVWKKLIDNQEQIQVEGGMPTISITKEDSTELQVIVLYPFDFGKTRNKC